MRLIDETIPVQMLQTSREKAPLTGPPKFGGLSPKATGGCTIVQVENELKGKIIPGSSGAAGEGEPHSGCK